jgi:hypothetical protein
VLSEFCNELNLVVLIGVVYREPHLRTAKDGRSILCFQLRIASSTRAEVIPVSCFGVGEGVTLVTEGERLIVLGEVRRQWFSGGRNFLDVLATDIAEANSVRSVRHILGSAMATLQLRSL